MVAPNRNRSRMSLTTITLAGFVITITAMWILSVIHLLPDAWAGIFTVVFAALSLLLVLFQPRLESRSESNSFSSRLLEHFGTEILGIHISRGALIVHTPENAYDMSLHLSKGFDNQQLRPEIAESATEYVINGDTLYLVIFPDLKPGNYTLFDHNHKHARNVTIRPNRLTYIDWGYLVF
jgi:hypothetical protein